MADVFNSRKLPWDGQGTIVNEALSSEDAIKRAGLDWKVVKHGLIDQETGLPYYGFAATVRESDNKILGAVSESRYKIVQNADAFRFTDRMLGEGVKYDTAGALFGGRKVWLSAKLPGCDILGDVFDLYLVFTNSHDGSGAVRVAVTPVRMVCSNTLNLALGGALRSWSCNHRGNLQDNLHEASKTLSLTGKYMARLKAAIEEMTKISVDEVMVEKFAELLLPIKKEDSPRKAEHIKEMRSDILYRWKNAPDLSETKKDGYRWMNAVSDFAIHTDLHNNTKNFNENLFGKVIAGNGLYIDSAYDILKNGGSFRG